MLEYNTPSVLVKCNDKKRRKMKKRASDNNISCAVFCQMEKKDHKKKYSQSNLRQTETVEEVIVLINMQGQLFKCVVEAPIRFLRVL